ncbi:MAG: pyridoxal-phosphate dependent enzyme [Bacteroidota bacterium]
MNSCNQQIEWPLLREKGVTVHVKREDLIHPLVSGNKYRKLKYNLFEARAQGFQTLLTFGGAFSNHIAATACAGQEAGFATIGVIRGAELEAQNPRNPTLQLAEERGMQLHFVSREAYRTKDTPHFLTDLKRQWGTFYLLPEGGTNVLAVKGCTEILTEADARFDIVCCSVGTGGTMAGLINAITPGQQVLGYPALKGDFLSKDIRTLAQNDHWALIADYHFGGYAKVTRALIDFINSFKKITGIPLDPIYTGKLLYGILDMVKKDQFKKGTRILAIHSGGLQGISGMNTVLKKKKLPLLEL